MDSYILLVFLVTIPNHGYVVGDFRLQILHINDMHARFDEVDENTVACPLSYSHANKCYGGFARIKQAADLMKDDAQKRNISSIFLNAGDTFQGTPYYSFYKWRIAASLMNTLGFDAMCLGNHEFDDGIDNLVHFLKQTKIPAVTVNLNRSTDIRLNRRLVKDSIVLDVKGHKIGIIGYLTPETMEISSTENLEILDEIPYLRAEAKNLKSQNVNFIIGLGHSGLTRDKQIAEQVEEIDLIVGGHSHSLLYNPKDKPPSREKVEESYPCWVTQKSGKRVPIVQSSAYTKYIGNLTITLDNKYKVVAVEGNSNLLDSTYKKDSTVNDKVKTWTSKLKKKLQTVVGKTRVSLTKSSFHDNKFESNFANLVTDALFHQGVLESKIKNSSQWTEFAVSMYQNGGIRNEFTDNERNEGNLTTEDILTALPFQNMICQCRLSGKALREALESLVIHISNEQRYPSHFLHFSGLRVIYDLQRPPGERVRHAMVICTRCSVPQYEELQSNDTYLTILNTFLIKGGDKLSVFKTSCRDVKIFGYVEADAVINYIQRLQVIYPILDGRLKIMEATGNPSETTIASNTSKATRNNWGLYNSLLLIVVCIRALTL